MEGDEMEMCKEELQMWIREKVKKQLISAGVLEEYRLLQSLLKKREEQAHKILSLCKSVAACEELVKKQYSLLGWEYIDPDSEDEDGEDEKNKTVGGTSPPKLERVQLENQASTSSVTKPLSPKLNDRESILISGVRSLRRNPVVVLTRLPSLKRRSLRSPTPQSNISESESLSHVGSDSQWEPEDDSCDSDYSTSSYNRGSKKRRKMDQEDEERDKRRKKTKARTAKGAKSDVTSTPQAGTKENGEDAAKKLSTTGTNGVAPLNKKTLHQSSDIPEGVQNAELSVDMDVLARKTAMKWLKAKILEMIKADDRVRYKVRFQDKGKKIVSGHHIALTCPPKVEQLSVGCRVVVKCSADPPVFAPGILAEVPCRKNRLRFLVFTDDHRSSYVSLSQLHQVFRPMKNPVDDIPDGAHKEFIKEYLKVWPYPPQLSYRIGQVLNAEYEGVQQKCKVVEADSSLIWVVFEKDQHKEPIYQASMRLQPKTKMNTPLTTVNSV